MSRTRFALLLVGWIGTVAFPRLVLGTSLLPPANLAELARDSDCVVLARAHSSNGLKRGILIFTLTEFTVLESLRGELPEGALFSVQIPGGEVNGESWLVQGAPRFEVDQTYFLCLKRKTDELWLPTMLSYGILKEIRTEDGIELLVSLPEARFFQPASETANQQSEPIVPYDKEVLLAHLTEVLLGRTPWNTTVVSVPPDAVGTESVTKGVPSGCAFFNSGGQNFRWKTFDNGGSATIYADATGDLSLPSGGLDLIPESLDIWMDIPGTSLNLEYGGSVEVNLSCGPGESAEDDVIVFNDPCSDIPDLDSCRGVLAFGGPRLFGSHSFDGTGWVTVTSWAVVVNNGTGGCLGRNVYRLMLAHELGHGLGFEHFNDTDSIMHSSCCRGVNSTDTTCTRFVYPAIDPENERPSVDAGPDQQIVLARDTVVLKGQVDDDGLPVTGEVTTAWRMFDGPGAIVFGDASALETTARFTRPGTYSIGLTAYDGQLLRTDQLQLDVQTGFGTTTVTTFQQGVDGYDGTIDTVLSENIPTTDQSATPELMIDADEPGGSGLASQTLLRFEKLFGTARQQIPPGVQINSAQLELSTTNFGDGATLHRMLVDWSEDDVWNSFGENGIQAGVESSNPEIVVAGSEGVRVDVTDAVAAWSQNPCLNHGWAFLPVGADGWDFFSSEGNIPPRLLVEHSLRAPELLVSIGEPWNYFEGRSNPPANWASADFTPPASWSTGVTGIGYGDGDDATVLRDMRGSYATVFCRRKFVVVSPQTIGRLILRIDYDDGFVAYLNGAEVARSTTMGSPGSAVNRNTLAQSREAGSVEQYFLDTGALREGDNVLAIEVHNASLGSSDLSFIPELAGFRTIVDEGATWNYFRASEAFPVGWNQEDFDDSLWERGPSGIGYGDGDDLTVVDDMQDNTLVLLCRKSFDLPEPSTLHRVLFSAIYDDGLVIYVNGRELGRANMPEGPVSGETPAEDNGEFNVITFEVPLELLREGNNLLAASVHNFSIDSSDLSFVPLLSTIKDAPTAPPRCQPDFLRGDVNSDHGLDISDPLQLLFHLFRQTTELSCPNAADSNNDGTLDITDVVFLLEYLFLDGPAPDEGVEC